MSDLMRMLIVRAPQPADATTTVEIPIGDPTAFQTELAAARKTALSRQRVGTTPLSALTAAPVTAAGPALAPRVSGAATTAQPQEIMWAIAEQFAGSPWFLADSDTIALAPKLKDFAAKLGDIGEDLADQPNLDAIVQAVFGETAGQFVGSGDYHEAAARLGDSLVAAWLSPKARLIHPDDTVLFLRLLRIAALIADRDPALLKKGGVADALAAHVLLPASIFPVDSSMIQPVGLADDWVVRDHVSRYEAGDIAIVENVLQGETRNHSTKHSLTTVQTLITDVEKTTETTTDVQATDRFDLKSEVDSTLKEDTNIKGGVTVKYDSAPWTVTANVDAAYSRSKTDSTKVATDQARDVVKRATTKVTERVRQQQSTQITESFEDDTDHSFTNTQPNAKNITGIYQWLNKILRVQMFDLGPRVIYDITVPEPAALLWDLKRQPPSGDVPQPPQPFTADPGTLFANTIGQYLTAYGVTGVPAPPGDHVTVSAAYDGAQAKDDDYNNGMVQAAVLTLPTGYEASTASISVEYTSNKDDLPNSFVNIEFGTNHLNFADISGTQSVNLGGEEGFLAVAVDTLHVHSYAVAIDVNCTLAPQALTGWQLQAHDAITQAYLQRVKDYKDALAAQTFQASATDVPQGTNPLRNDEVARSELKRQAITLLAGPTIDLMSFNGLLPDPFHAGQNYPRPDPVRAQSQGRIVRFFEQALEWENMNYFLYPYYWGRASTWYQRVLADDSDPVFGAFLRAGAARVVVPVRKGFESDIQIFVASGGQVWGGSPMPDVHDPDYLPIAKEIEAAQNPDLGTPGEWWETTLPTNQIYLRDSSKLPSWTVDDKWHWTPAPDGG